MYLIFKNWVLPAGIILYLIPALSLILFPFDKKIKFGKIHSAIGRLEWVLSFLRDGLFAPLMLAYFIYELVRFFRGAAELQWLLFAGLGFFTLSVWAYFNRRFRIHKFIDFISKFFIFHPSEFFQLYYSSVSGFPGFLPQNPSVKIGLPLDFSSGNQKKSFWPVIPGVVDTGIFARLVIKAARWGDKKYCRRIGDVVSATWGARNVQLAGGRLEAEGVQHLKVVTGRTIFVCNHKSFLDFAVVPCILGVVNQTRKEPFRARYLAAREHFLDNIFFYRVLGIGRALEKVGAVFVDRKSKKKPAKEAVNDAVGSVINDRVDIVMYPQGTRAYGNVGPDGRRMDAGYYTTVSINSVTGERGHLKKGAAYLAVDVAARLAERNGKLNVIPVGIVGTATVVPRGKIVLKKGVTIMVSFGNSISIGKADFSELNKYKPGTNEYSEVRGGLVESVYGKIDQKLKDLLLVHEGLKKRLVIDSRRFLREDVVERFLEALIAWRDDEDLIFSIIDCIYTLPPRLWKPYINQLAQMLIETDTSRETVVEFKKMIVGEMIKRR